jgi:hypothetical protein
VSSPVPPAADAPFAIGGRKVVSVHGTGSACEIVGAGQSDEWELAGPWVYEIESRIEGAIEWCGAQDDVARLNFRGADGQDSTASRILCHGCEDGNLRFIDSGVDAKRFVESVVDLHVGYGYQFPVLTGV